MSGLREWWRMVRPSGVAAEVAGERSETAADEAIADERAESAVHRAPSLQSRITNGLAFTLIGALVVGSLGWYYAHTVASRANARQSAREATQTRAQGEMTLPPLGRVDPPTRLERLLGPEPEAPPEMVDSWLEPPGEEPSSYAVGTPPGAPAATSTKTPEELALERMLSGPVFASAAQASAPELSRAGAHPPEPGASDLDALLAPRATTAVGAQILPTERLLLPKGAFVDCTLETAIDSTLPGMTTCITATDTFSVDGSVVLLERGTKLVGETRGQVRQGAARLFVLWTEARTPTGVIVPLASPGTDELGRSGLPGEVDRHFWERFGAAILVSVIDGAVQAAVQSQRDGGDDTIIYDPGAGRDIMTEVLRSTINIPPTIVKPQGDRIQVLVARDLDFRSVYELRRVSGG